MALLFPTHMHRASVLDLLIFGRGAQLFVFVDTTLWRKLQVGHGYITSNVVPVFAVAVVVENWIMVDKAVWDQSALGPSRRLIILLHHIVGSRAPIATRPG